MPFASFGEITGDCVTGLAAGSCRSGSNVTAYVTKLCVGIETCSVTVDFEIFGDPCPGQRKQLGIEVTCGKSPHGIYRPAFRLAVVVPVGTKADVVVPLRGVDPAVVKVTEGGAAVWSRGEFLAAPGVSAGGHDQPRGGIRFEVAQGSYMLELLV